jgi:hypothetical protein
MSFVHVTHSLPGVLLFDHRRGESTKTISVYAAYEDCSPNANKIQLRLTQVSKRISITVEANAFRPVYLQLPPGDEVWASVINNDACVIAWCIEHDRVTPTASMNEPPPTRTDCEERGSSTQ